MSGENTLANQLVADAMKNAEQDSHLDKDTMARAILNAVLTEMATYRSVKDIGDEISYIMENLDEDEFVITRGC